MAVQEQVQERRSHNYTPVYVDGKLDRIELEIHHEKHSTYYRVVKLLRVRRIPREVAQVEALIEMHRDIVAGFRSFTEARLVVIGACSRQLGLIWCYGVAVADHDLERARTMAEECFTALMASLRGSYRQIVVGLLTKDEATEVLRLVQSSDYGAVLWGLPEPRTGGWDERRYLGERIGVRIVEVLEEILRGLVAQNKEFAYVVMGQAVEPRKLVSYLKLVGDLASRYSDYEGNVGVYLGLSIPLGWTLSKNVAESLSRGLSEGVQHAKAKALTHSVSDFQSTARGEAEGYGTTKSFTEGRSWAETTGEAHTRSETWGHSEAKGWSETESHSFSRGYEESESFTRGWSKGEAESWARTQTEGYAHGRGEHGSESLGASETKGWSDAVTKGTAETTGQAEMTSKAETKGTTDTGGFSVSGTPFGIGMQGQYSHADHKSTTETTGTTTSTSKTDSESTTKTTSGAETTSRTTTSGWSTSEEWSRSVAEQLGGSRSYSTSESEARGRSESWGESWGTAKTKSESVTESYALGSAYTTSRSFTEGRSVAEGFAESRSRSLSKVDTKGSSTGLATSESEGEAKSLGRSAGESTTLGYGSAVVTGIWPTVGLSMSRRTMDEVRRAVYDVLRIEVERAKLMNAMGGFYAMACLLSPERDIVASVRALAASALQPTKFVPHPLRVLEADGELLRRVRTFSFDLRENGRGLQPYRHMTILNALELASLTHPPRLEVQGIEVVAENVPEFVIPPREKLDIELGTVVSHETMELTGVRWGFKEEELGHVGVFGASGSGKTVCAMKLAKELSERGYRVCVVDWKFEWRRLVGDAKGKTALYTLYRNHFNVPALKWNPLRPPRGMPWREWMRLVIEWFVLTYGLGSRSLSVLRKHLFNLYAEHTAKGKCPTLKNLYKSLKVERDRLERSKKVSFERLDVYDKILDRLWPYAEGDLADLFGDDVGVDVTDIVLQNDFTDFEAYGLSETDKPFILSLIVFALYYRAVYSGAYERPLFIVVEEAHRVAFKYAEHSSEAIHLTEDAWGQLAAMGRAYNVYCVFVVQYPSRLNPMVLANLFSVISFRLNLNTGDSQDISTMVWLFGKDPVRFSNEYARFMSRLPIGYGVAIKKRVKEFFRAEPSLVKFDRYEPSIKLQVLKTTAPRP